MTFDSREGGGAAIDIVIEGSPAEKSGFVVGDVVKKVRGQDVRDAADLKRLLNELPIGEPIPCTVERAGKDLDLVLKMGVR
jgi:S1-C subfamily serine protease